MKPHRSLILAVLVATVSLWNSTSMSAAAAPTYSATWVLAQVSSLRITHVEPTPLFPKTETGQPLKQLARLHLDNSGEPVAVVAKVTVGSQAPDTQDLGLVAQGPSIVNIRIPDIASPTQVTIEVQSQDGTALASQQLDWQPQKKWHLYCVAYSHHDLGFGNYPHRLRTEIRHANIERPLQYCRETDSWDEDSKFRFMIETSEPLPSFLGTHTVADAEELARRVREGRIQIGALHNTANTEQLGHELLARLFYLSNRHSRDLLNIPASRTAQIDDVIGLTWPLATFCAEADIPYFFHGPNMCGRCLQPADSEPVFYWQGPDRHGQVLTRSAFYGGYAGDSPGDVSETHIVNCINKLGANWPYDALLLQEGSDFQLVTMDTANRIHTWNAAWAYPHLVCATMDMFFDALAKQADPTQIKTFAKDSNNQWADQDSNDAWLLSHARRAGELIPTAEKFSTIALATSGGGYPWTDIYQAYHRLLAYHEHTNAIDGIGPNRERMRQYETELAENREMVAEAQEFAGNALTGALDKLVAAIPRSTHAPSLSGILLRGSGPMSFILPTRPSRPAIDCWTLARTRKSPGRACPTGQSRSWPPACHPWDIGLLRSRPAVHRPRSRPCDSLAPTLENRYYRVTFDATTGTITGLFDKELNVELVDQAAPHRFNEYLYERFESSDWDAPRAWHRVGTAQLTTSGGPVADVMKVAAVAAGVESLQQTVILYRDLKRIDFVLDLFKSPSGRRDTLPPSNPLGKESVYVALPFAVPEHAFRHELPGCVSEPVSDLFDGACTAYYAVRHFSDVSNRRYGVTVSAPDSSLFEYDHPRSCPIRSGGEGLFERTKTPPATSRMYLYLMNNMFDVNVRWDQPGPVQFRYSMRSHTGDWQAGRADEFGWDVMNPLIATVAEGKHEGKQQGPLPAASHSFLTIDCPNVACTTIKPAEANGSGFILRFVETQGEHRPPTSLSPACRRSLQRLRPTWSRTIDRTRLPSARVTASPFLCGHTASRRSA